MIDNKEHIERAKRQSNFDGEVATYLKETYGMQVDQKTNRHTIFNTEFGNIDYYPMSDKLMIHNPHRWMSGGFEWIMNNLY